MVIAGSEIVPVVGHDRLRRPRTRRHPVKPEPLVEPEVQWIEGKRNRPPVWKQKCDKIGLASFLQAVGYPLREDPVNVSCAKAAFFLQVTLEAQGRIERLLLCKNHCQWVNERENKLRDLNVKATAPSP
jgi:hypothetical protein